MHYLQLQLQEAKFEEKNCTLFFNNKQFNKENAPNFLIFWFERPFLRYLQKTVFSDQLNG